MGTAWLGILAAAAVAGVAAYPSVRAFSVTAAFVIGCKAVVYLAMAAYLHGDFTSLGRGDHNDTMALHLFTGIGSMIWGVAIVTYFKSHGPRDSEPPYDIVPKEVCKSNLADAIP